MATETFFINNTLFSDIFRWRPFRRLFRGSTGLPFAGRVSTHTAVHLFVDRRPIPDGRIHIIVPNSHSNENRWQTHR